jgi:hypothetical protein
VKTKLAYTALGAWIPLLLGGCLVDRSGLPPELDGGKDVAQGSIDVPTKGTGGHGTGGMQGTGGVNGTGGSGGVLGRGGSGGLGEKGGVTGTGGKNTGGSTSTQTGSGGTGCGGSGSGGTGNGGTTSGTGGLTGTGGHQVTGGKATGGRMGTGGRIGNDASPGTGGTGGTTTCVFAAPEPVTGLGRDTWNFYSPSLSADGKTLYYAANDGNSEDDIYTATRDDSGTHFRDTTYLASINSNFADGSPAISYDGLTLYFYSTRLFGIGDRDIWYAKRDSLQEDFGMANLLGSVNGMDEDNLQWLSQDELTIVFSSKRSGASDLYTATRTTPTSPFSTPVPVPAINGPYREDRAALTKDGLTIYFVTERPGGPGDKDIWFATRDSPDGDFKDAKNIEAINSTYRDIDVALSWDEKELFFVSKRNNTDVFRMYRSLRDCH